MSDRPLPFPAGWGVALDPALRRIDDGTVLVGGYPLRVLRLTGDGAAAVADWASGQPVEVGGGTRSARAALARRLVESGMAHPRPAPGAGANEPFSLVIPTIGRIANLTRLLGSALDHDRAWPNPAEVIVVDDGSEEPKAVQALVERFGGLVLRSEERLGPATARNLGWRAASHALVAFLDDDCRCPTGPDWVVSLLDHLADPAVALAAPRVRSARGAAPGWLAAYEESMNPLDRGGHPAPIRPGSRVPFVPGAALLVRREALESAGGFDESLRVGEDVDLIWRLSRSGWSTRYEPASVVTHHCRPDVVSMAVQRYRYGTSAAALDQRHPGSVAPLSVSGWSTTAWTAAALGGPAGAVGGVAVGAASMVLLAKRLRGLHHPWREAWALAGRGNLAAGTRLAAAGRREWWPLVISGAVLGHYLSRREGLAARVGRRMVWVAAGVTAGPPLGRSLAGHTRSVGWIRWLLLRTVDDLAYGTGVWASSLSCGRAGALLPRQWKLGSQR